MKQKPVYLNLFAIRFPMTAIVSILHRVSGVGLFFFIPYCVWVLHYSLASEHHFNQIKSYLEGWLIKSIVWLGSAMLFYHGLAGIRHLLMDCHMGDSKRVGRFTAICVLLVSVIFTVWIGYQLWC